MLSVNGEAKALSDDHKPSNDGVHRPVYTRSAIDYSIPGERKRIINAGGYIEFGRVNG